MYNTFQRQMNNLHVYDCLYVFFKYHDTQLISIIVLFWTQKPWQGPCSTMEYVSSCTMVLISCKYEGELRTVVGPVEGVLVVEEW